MKQKIKGQVCQAMILKLQFKLKKSFDKWKKFYKMHKITEDSIMIDKQKLSVIELILNNSEKKVAFLKWKEALRKSKRKSGVKETISILKSHSKKGSRKNSSSPV